MRRQRSYDPPPLRVIRYAWLGFGLAFRAAPRLVIVTACLQVTMSAAALGLVLISGRLAERLVQLPNEGADGVELVVLVFLAVTVVAFSTSLIRDELQWLLSEQAEQYATDMVLQAAVRADLRDYEEPAFHNLLIRSLEGANERPAQLIGALLGLISATITSAALLLIVASVAPELLVLILIGGIPLWWTTRRTTGATYSFAVAQTERDRRYEYFHLALSSRTSAAEVRVFGIGDELRSRVRRLHTERLDDLRQLVRQRISLAMVSVLVSAAVGGVVLLRLIGRLEADAAEADRVAVVAVGALVLAQRIQALSSSATSVLECSLFLNDLDRFTSGVASGTVLPNDADPIRELRLESVDFTYPAADTPTVRGVDLELRSGEVVAIVGPNGSGKTTLAKILCLLLEPTAGRILLNGRVHVHSHSPTSRRAIAAVHQDFLQLLTTAADNIALGDLDATDGSDRIVAAARFAEIDAVIANLPNGYETFLGTEFSGGRELSRGQWQRLSIARAWFSDADVLVLDEPTAALDPEAEAKLIDQVLELAGNKLVILISHRFAAVSKADRILVLDSGSVVEHGNHDELMARNGIYASMYRMQADQFR